MQFNSHYSVVTNYLWEMFSFGPLLFSIIKTFGVMLFSIFRRYVNWLALVLAGDELTVIWRVGLLILGTCISGKGCCVYSV